MNPLLATCVDASIFVGLAWAAWRLLGRSIPIAVVPIVIGLLLAACGGLPAQWGVPSHAGDKAGWFGVLLLAFSAGMETRQFERTASPGQAPAAAALRFYGSAAVALALPFVAGSWVAYRFLWGMPGWSAPNGDRLLGSLGLGLCIAVSALPVLIGIVRELGPLHRPLTRVALAIAVVDDAVLWTGLALLLLVAHRDASAFAWSSAQWLALAVPVALVGVGRLLRRAGVVPPQWAIWLSLPVYLGVGAWASMTWGLHELLGAYFAGAMVPSAWSRRLPVAGLGKFALVGLAPLFFGHSGLKIDGNALGWASLQAALALLALSVVAKLAAVLIWPPSAAFSRRETLAVGALLQCKGLMEIVAATVLRDKGLISEQAFAALLTLAVLSTLLTGPFFRWVLRGRDASDRVRARSIT